MIKYVTYIMLVVLVMMQGCASASATSEEKSNEAKSFTPKEDSGTVYMYRAGRAVGAAMQLSVKINGRDAGGTSPGSFFKWDLAPGTYTFNSSTAESSATVSLDVKPGEIYYLRQDARLGVTSAGRVTLVEVDENKGKSEIANCKLLVSSYVPQ